MTSRHTGNTVALFEAIVEMPAEQTPDRVELERELDDDPEVPPAATSAQKSSAFSLSLAVSTLPSAVTTVAWSRLSSVRPYVGDR